MSTPNNSKLPCYLALAIYISSSFSLAPLVLAPMWFDKEGALVDILEVFLKAI
jgi:hypothetical protein